MASVGNSAGFGFIAVFACAASSSPGGRFGSGLAAFGLGAAAAIGALSVGFGPSEETLAAAGFMPGLAMGMSVVVLATGARFVPCSGVVRSLSSTSCVGTQNSSIRAYFIAPDMALLLALSLLSS